MKSSCKSLVLGSRAAAGGLLLACALVQAPAWAEAPSWRSDPQVASVPKAAPLCAQCGVVEAVTPAKADAGNPSGLGAAAGAFLGGWLANQMSTGEGKNFATILGMLGGTWAGNMLEKQFRQGSAYRIDVRMADGSLRSVDHSSALPVGSTVRVDGNSVTPAAPDGTPAPTAERTAT